ncbi:MAG: hypothetical protein WC728_11975 [Elusimicrobiota bacterium]
MGPLVRIGIRLSYLAVLIAPLFGLFDYMCCFPQIAIGFEMPWYYKGAKDILLGLVCLLFSGAILSKRRLRVSGALFLFFVFLLVCAVLNFLVLDNHVITLVGIRSLATLLLAFFSYCFFSEEEIAFLARCVVFVALLMVPLSIIQFLYGAQRYGALFDKYAARVAATFIQPSSLGVFLVLAIFLLSHYFPRSKFRNCGLFVLTANVLLTGSGIAILGVVLLVFLSVRRKLIPSSQSTLSPALVFVLPFAVYFISLNLPTITSRPDILLSGQGRIDVIRQYFESQLSMQNVLFGKGLGYGTNSLFTIFPELGGAYGFIPDSMYVSVIAQLGLLGLMIFLILNVHVYAGSNSPLKELLLVVLFCGLTVNILELFPVNWIYPIVLGFLLRRDPHVGVLPRCQERPRGAV